MDLLKPNTFRPVLQPSKNTVVHQLQAAHDAVVPQIFIDKNFPPEYDPVMLTQFNGFVRVVRTSEELPFAPDEWVTELFVPMTHNPIHKVTLYTQRIGGKFTPRGRRT